MTDEHKTGQRVSDAYLEAYLKKDWTSPHDGMALDLRDARASEARLTKQLAARNAEIETWKAYTADHIQAAVSRAERFEADLKAARTVDDEKIDRALHARVPGGAEVWHWLPQRAKQDEPHDTARNVMRAALTAALSPGQVGEETKVDISRRCADMSNAELEAEDMRLARLWHETRQSDGHGGSPGEWIYERSEENKIERDRRAAPQSHDQPSGSDDSDAAFLMRSSKWGIVNIDPEFKRLHEMAAHRASQPSDAVAEVERLNDAELADLFGCSTKDTYWYYNQKEWRKRADEFVADRNRRTLPPAPEPAQEPVAWQWRLNGNRDGLTSRWHECTERQAEQYQTNSACDVRPLYAAPPSPKASR